MPRFMVLGKGTIEIKKNLKEAKKSFGKLSELFKARDAKILSAYAVMGQHDLMFITEAPDLSAAFELAAMIGTLGSLDCETYPIMPLEELYEFI